MNIDIDIDIQQEDYTLSPCGPLGGRIGLGVSGGEFIGEYADVDEALDVVRDRMDREQFWPSIWWVSDHGNFWPIDLNGDEVK